MYIYFIFQNYGGAKSSKMKKKKKPSRLNVSGCKKNKKKNGECPPVPMTNSVAVGVCTAQPLEKEEEEEGGDDVRERERLVR